jgi:BirA family transcriptional regulator, biotin operon repressor / biotin---[acetyl-CoA-carboxylase] ligase
MDIININEIQKKLTAGIIGKTMVNLYSVDSTNTYALNLIKGINKIPKLPDYNGAVVISETQTNGRGRLERKWFSPAGGIWMTIILFPDLKMQDLSKITLLTASSIAETLIKNYKISLSIKWPNDIYFDGKKLCGILSESEKVGDKTYLIIGIGINVNNNSCEGKNENLNATSLKEITGKQINRNFLIAKILNKFEAQYTFYSKTLNFKDIFKKIENIMIY